MRNRFKDKVAVITGGASGIGKALCQELGRRRTIVVVADINEEDAKGVAQSIISDVSREESSRRLVMTSKPRGT